MKYKEGDKVISNLGGDVNKKLTITRTENDGTIWFDDGQCSNIKRIKKGELIFQNSNANWKERYGGKK